MWIISNFRIFTSLVACLAFFITGRFRFPACHEFKLARVINFHAVIHCLSAVFWPSFPRYFGQKWQKKAWTLLRKTSAGCALEYGTYLIERHGNLKKIASEYRSGYSSWRCVVKCTRKQSYLKRKFGWNICDMYTTSRVKRYLLNITAAILAYCLYWFLTLILLYRNDYISSSSNFYAQF